MKMNEAAFKILEDSEIGMSPAARYKAGERYDNAMGTYYVPYRDPVGIPTIGLGTIEYEDGTPVTMQDKPIVRARAVALFNWEQREKAAVIERWAQRYKVFLNENQFSALLCFAYNCGTGPITDEGSSLRKALLARDPAKIRAAFNLYVKGTVKFMGIRVKKTLPGLVIRRKKEADLFFS